MDAKSYVNEKMAAGKKLGMSREKIMAYISDRIQMRPWSHATQGIYALGFGFQIARAFCRFAPCASLVNKSENFHKLLVIALKKNNRKTFI